MAKRLIRRNRSRESLNSTSGQMDTCLMTARGLRELAEKEASLVQNVLRDMENNLIDPGYTLELTKSIHRSRTKSTDDDIKRNTEILLNEHAVLVRQNVIQKMKNEIQEMHEEMSRESQKLGEDFSNFFDFIQDSYELASNSFKKVIEIAKNNYDKVQLIMALEDKLLSLNEEIKELEPDLIESLMAYEFLKSLSPQKYEKEAFPIRKDFLRSFGPTYSDEDRESLQKEVLEEVLANWKFVTPADVTCVSSTEVMEMVRRLKESNLSLLQNTRLNRKSSSLEMIDLSAQKTQMTNELAEWDEKIAATEIELESIKEINGKLNKKIRNLEEETVRSKKLRTEELKKLLEIYKLCTDSEAEVHDSVLMRTVIDHDLQGILSEIKKHPKKKVKEVLKTLEAEKKLSERKAEEALRAERATKRMRKTLTPAIRMEKKNLKKNSK